MNKEQLKHLKELFDSNLTEFLNNKISTRTFKKRVFMDIVSFAYDYGYEEGYDNGCIDGVVDEV